jgi:predicted HTH transcriptional regulator
LQGQPTLERELFKGFDSFTFEEQLAKSFLTPENLVQLLDYPSFFTLNRIPLPENRSEIIEHLQLRGLVSFTTEKEWSITNLGALLYASDFDQFPELRRKAARVVVYKGTGRTQTIREHTGKYGYATGFKGLIRYIRDALPAHETIEDSGFRDNQELIPPLVIREIIANALVHQDLAETSINPLVEIFSDRIEVTNPGQPLVDPLRFIDAPSKSRNPKLGDELRRIGLVEEKGSGWDKIATQLGKYQLPPAQIEVEKGYTRITVSGEKDLNSMDKDERIVAVYQQACLNYVNREDTNNASIRVRFGITEKNKAKASRILKEAKEHGAVVPYDKNAGPRNLRYVPFWAETYASD